MKNLLLIGLIISSTSVVAQAQQNDHTLVQEFAKSGQKNQAPVSVEASLAPLNEGLTEKEIQKSQEQVRQQAENKELSKYWKFSNLFFEIEEKL